MQGDVREVIAGAICYYRFRGASLRSIDAYARSRANRRDYAARRTRALNELEAECYVEKRGNLWYLHPIAFKEARGASYLPEFEAMDFCIALAIGGAGDDCDLRRLIANCDFIARTWPSYDELYGGLNRLAASRLIKHKRGRFSLTPRAKALFDTAKSKANRSMYDQLMAFQRLVLCPCCGVTLKRVAWRVALSQVEYSAALKAHQHSMKESSL